MFAIAIVGKIEYTYNGLPESYIFYKLSTLPFRDLRLRLKGSRRNTGDFADKPYDNPYPGLLRAIT